jgi:hypothetical protein
MIRRIHRWTRSIAVGVCVIAAMAGWAVWQEIQSLPAQLDFPRLVAEFSEPNGWFDTDNLISNEKSYLHVMRPLERAGLSGGVYIGVGPDTSFSYMARIRPSVAFIVDIRRDNLLLHLLFKALFRMSRNRMEYLALLTGTPAPEDLAMWNASRIDEIVAYLDAQLASSAPPLDQRLRETIAGFGVPVSAKEMETILRFHGEFMARRLSLRFHSTGRLPRSYYPTYRELLLETDPQGGQRSFLARESDFQFLRSMQARDAVIPVVGDLGGTHALAAIGRWMRDHNQRLSALYVSNVEDYLFRDQVFGQYMDNLSRLPRSDRSLVIRSVFGRWGLADSAPGYYSTSTTQDLDEMLTNFSSGKYRTYTDLLR